jgi:hypothetical protein
MSFFFTLNVIIGTIFVACFPIGFCMMVVDWLRRPPEISEEEVRRAVERYRGCYREEVQHVLRDHIHGARLAGGGRHRQLLMRAVERIVEEDGRAPFRMTRRDQ